MNIGGLIASLGVDDAGLMDARRSMLRMEESFKKSTDNINRRLNTIGKTAKNIGRDMTRYLTLPLLAVGVGALKLYMDFEASMSKIVGLVGVAKDQVDAWGADILKLAPQLGKAPKELADALFFVTSAGIRGAEAMEVLTASAKASASGLGETKVVADLVTSAMNAYGKEILTAQMATDILVTTVKEGKAEAPALAASMGQVLPIASAMGVSFDQVGAAIASMTRTGTEASTASIQLRQILASILKPSSQAKQALEGMGTSAQELRKTIREDGLIAVLGKLKTLSKSYGDETLSTVFPNIRALSGVLDIMGENAEDNIKIFESLTKSSGALNNAFEETASTTKFKYNKAIASSKAALTEFGEALKMQAIPLLEKITKTLVNVTTWFKNLSDAQKQNVIRITALLAVVGPLLTVFGFLATKVLPVLINGVGSAIKVFNALRLAMLANPFTAIATAVTILVVAFFALRKRVDDVTAAQTALNDVNTIANQNIAEQKSKVDQLFRVAQNENLSLKHREEALRALNRISPEYFGNLTLEKIKTEEATTAKQKYIQELLREAKVRAAQEKLVELEKRAIDELVLGGARDINGMQKLVANLINQFAGIGAATAFSLKKANKNFNATEKEITSTQQALQELLDSILTLDDIAGNAPPIIPSGGGGGGGTSSMDSGTVLKDLQEELSFIRTMNDLLGDSFDATGARASAYSNALQGLVKAGMNPASSAIQDLAFKVNQFNEAQFVTKEVAFGFVEELSKIDTMAEAFGETFDKNGAQLRVYKSAMMDLIDNGLRPGDVAFDSLKTKIQDTEQAIKNTAKVLTDAQKSMVNGIIGVAEGLGTAIVDLNTGLSAVAGSILDTLQAIINQMLAVTITALLMKETTKFGIFGIASAAVGIALVKAIVKKQLSGIPKAKDGGTVPPGFPNDTYPAFLTSGETIIPNGGNSSNEKDFAGVLEGHDIYFAYNKYKNYIERNS